MPIRLGVLTATRCASSASVPTDFRCYDRLELRARAASVLAIVGRNGAGKTSLLEAVHFGALGWSPRTSDERRVVAHRRRRHARRADADRCAAARPRWAVGFQPGSRSARSARRRAAARRSTPLAEHARRARLHAGAARRREGRAGAAPRATSTAPWRGSWPALRAAVAGAYARALAAAQPAAAPHPRRRQRRATRWTPWDGQLAQLGAEIAPRRAAASCARCAEPVRASIWRALGEPRRGRSSCATGPRARATRRASWPSSRRAAPATSSAAARRPARTSTTSRSREGERDLRASARRASSARPCWRCSWPRPTSCARCAACARPAARRRRQRARRAAAAQSLLGLLRAARPGARHRDGHASARRGRDRVIRVDDGRAHPE